MEKLEAHPIAAIVPPPTEQEYNDLRKDIEENGLIDGIEVYQGKILDGRARYKICEELEIRCPQRVFKGDDDAALKFVISRNVRRRHLNESQRAMIAADLATKRVGNPNFGSNSANWHYSEKSLEEAGKELNVSRRTTARAKALLREGTPELIEKVRAGKQSVSGALTVIRGGKKSPEVIAREKAWYDSHRREGPLGLTREEVDPDFKGTPLEFTRKYGHVNLFTKSELEKREAIKRADKLSVALRDFVAAVPIDVTEQDIYIWSKDNNKRRSRLEERLDSFWKTVELIRVLTEENKSKKAC